MYFLVLLGAFNGQRLKDERSGSVFLNMRSTQCGARCSEVKEGEKGVDPPRILEVEAHEHGGGHDGR